LGYQYQPVRDYRTLARYKTQNKKKRGIRNGFVYQNFNFPLSDVNANVNVHKPSWLTAAVKIDDGFNNGLRLKQVPNHHNREKENLAMSHDQCVSGKGCTLRHAAIATSKSYTIFRPRSLGNKQSVKRMICYMHQKTGINPKFFFCLLVGGRNTMVRNMGSFWDFGRTSF